MNRIDSQKLHDQRTICYLWAGSSICTWTWSVFSCVRPSRNEN